MIYSEGLEKQHLAYAQSADLMEWVLKGPIIFPTQSWMSVKHGAPFVWKDEGMWLMILMGTDATHHTSLGLLSSPDGVGWTALPEG